MKDKGLVSFFDVNKCGFYRARRGKYKLQEPAELGSLGESISHVISWVKDRGFEKTVPWDPEASPHRQRYYCKSFAVDEETGDSVIVFWKQYSDESGNLNGIVADSLCGSTEGDSVRVGNKIRGKKVIYGQPMYYWFIPEKNMLASIKFSHSVADTEHVCVYIKNCIDYRIDHPCKKTSEEEIESKDTFRKIKVKRITYKSEKGDYSLYYRLNASLQKIDSGSSDLSKLASKITHIVVRDTISTSVKDDRKSHIKIWDIITGNKPKTFDKKQIEILSEVSLSEDDLRSIIKTHSEEYHPGIIWNNIGFKSGQHEATRWFNEYVERKHIEINNKDGFNDTYYPADVILKKIISERDDLLSNCAQSLNDSSEEEDKVIGSN